MVPQKAVVVKPFAQGQVAGAAAEPHVSACGGLPPSSRSGRGGGCLELSMEPGRGLSRTHPLWPSLRLGRVSRGCSPAAAPQCSGSVAIFNLSMVNAFLQENHSPRSIPAAARHGWQGSHAARLLLLLAGPLRAVTEARQLTGRDKSGSSDNCVSLVFSGDRHPSPPTLCCSLI